MSDFSQKKTRASPLKQRPEQLLPEKDQDVSTQSETQALLQLKTKQNKTGRLHSETPERLLSEKDQGISPHTASWATSRNGQGFSPCQRPEQLLPEKNQGVSPQSET